MQRIEHEGEPYITVQEFSYRTRRQASQIYELVNKGNRYGKLRSRKFTGRVMIPLSEVESFPFTAADKYRIMLAKKLLSLEERVVDLEAKLERAS